MVRWMIIVFVIAPLVLGAAPEAAGRSPVTGVEILIVQAPEIGTFQENASMAGFDAATGDSCGSDHFELSPEEGQFRFSESTATTGCGEIGHLVRRPAGGTAFRVRFRADRVIERAESSLPVPPPDGAPAQATLLAPQRLSLYGPPETRLLSVAYFDSSEGSRPAILHEAGPFPLKDDTPYNVTWYFEDVGTTATGSFSTGSGDAFSATVSEIRLVWDPIPVDPPVPLSAANETVDNTTVTRTTWGFTYPQGLARGNDTAQLRLRLLGDSIVSVHAPDGTMLGDAGYRVEESADGITLLLPHDTLAAHGPGRYTFVYETRAPLPPVPPPPAPTRILAIALIALALPALPGAFAVRTGVDYRRRAFGPYIGTARNLMATIGVLIGIYLLLLFFVLATPLFDTVTTLPLVFEAVFIYGQLALLVLFFVALAIVPGRYLVRTMREDLDRRQRLQAELERSNRELEQFAYVASHDLQEPLRTISGFTQLLRRRYADAIDERGLEYIERTVRGTERMQRLINDLLAFSRVRTRGLPFQSVDLDVVLREVLDDLATRIQDSATAMATTPLPTVTGDHSQLRQVFANLVQNAIRYRDPERPVTIRIAATEEHASWHFTVADDGPGIPAEFHERIFVLFQRLVPREEDGEETGTGMGLAICKRIVERHGGHIWVESTPGQGATFHFTIPHEPPEYATSVDP